MTKTMVDCPRHEGAYDCTPFCDVCEGEQEYEYDLKASLIEGIRLHNEGSDNPEYLRGQLELAMFLLGATYDNNEIVSQLKGYDND